jgi:hypothetical protein
VLIDGAAIDCDGPELIRVLAELQRIRDLVGRARCSAHLERDRRLHKLVDKVGEVWTVTAGAGVHAIVDGIFGDLVTLLDDGTTDVCCLLERLAESDIDDGVRTAIGDLYLAIAEYLVALDDDDEAVRAAAHRLLLSLRRLAAELRPWAAVASTDHERCRGRAPPATPDAVGDPHLLRGPPAPIDTWNLRWTMGVAA